MANGTISERYSHGPHDALIQVKRCHATQTTMTHFTSRTSPASYSMKSPINLTEILSRNVLK